MGTVVMRSADSSRMLVVKKEEKEARLKEFILKDLAARSAEPQAGLCGVSYQVVARSPESPVARALASLADETAAAGIVLQMVFTRFDAPHAARLAATSGRMPAAVCRTLIDPRLLDAHELLVLGPRTAWIGDCMRREPDKRDAYECYSQDCAVTAADVRRSFERLWNAAVSTDVPWPAAACADLPGPDLLEAAPPAISEAPAAPVVSTRH